MSNDYIAAYPPVCATSDRGDGKMRITWPGWGLDRVLLAALTTSHYVANVSLGTPESAAILATGGTEGGGFWIDVDLTFSGSTWLNTHRYSPQRQSTVYYYTTFNLARAAMVTAANHDNVFLWDNNILGGLLNTGIVGPTSVGISCWGGRANQQNYLGSTASSQFYYLGDVLSSTPTVTWQNLTMSGERSISALFFWKATSGTAGGGFVFNRIIASSPGGGFFRDGSTVTLAVTFTFSECVLTGFAMNGALAIITFGSNTGAASTVLHCTIGASGTIGITNASKYVTYTNNLVFECVGSCYATKTNGTYTKCAATDATGSEAGLNSLTRAQLAFYNENDNGFFDAGYGILTTSVLYHAGADTADATDIKGLARHATTPSIGAYEGTVNAFAVTWPTAGQVLKSAGAFQQFSGATTPTYDDDNLADGNVRPVAYGVGHTGDLANLAPTDAAYIALEATRNDADGIATSQIVVPKAPKIKGTTYTGTARIPVVVVTKGHAS